MNIEIDVEQFARDIKVQKTHQTGHPSRFYPATHVA